MSDGIPQSVLSDALQERIAGRQVRAAVFTTYTFDPGFFEVHVLPCLFDRPFSQIDKVRRIQLEDALRSVDDLAVYYDRTALAQDALPAQLDFRRIDVRRRTGVFHPKLALVLVDQPTEEESPAGMSSSQRLIVATLSANLTRAGWWENVETGHIEEIQDKDDDTHRCSFRGDLLRFVELIRRSAADGEEHAALDRIREFLVWRVPRHALANNSARGRYYTRVYVGQTDLPSWLAGIGLGRHEWNLEIISPYFDGHGVGTLRQLMEALDPREVRLFLPEDVDGTAHVAEPFFRAMEAESRVAWSSLPDTVLRPGGRKTVQNAVPRWVHAKVYRLWNRDGQEVVLTGSVNLTAAAHSHARAGNLEAAFLVDISPDQGRPSWWLKPLENRPTKFAEQAPQEDDDSNEAPIDITFRFDWSSKTLSYRLAGTGEGLLTVCEPAGRVLFTVNNTETGGWIECGVDEAAAVRDLLASTSFLEVRHSRGNWRVLVREEGMSHRPSLLMQLTPEEILLYWSLLSPAQREAFITTKLGTAAQLEGLVPRADEAGIGENTIFDRFAGVFHAFGRLQTHVTEALAHGFVREAEARLFGAKYDSLPVLLQKVYEANDRDPVIRYLTFLCAQQVRDEIAGHFPEFWQAHQSEAALLEAELRRSDDLRATLQLKTGSDHTAFFAWYETVFLRRARPAEVAP